MDSVALIVQFSGLTISLEHFLTDDIRLVLIWMIQAMTSGKLFPVHTHTLKKPCMPIFFHRLFSANYRIPHQSPFRELTQLLSLMEMLLWQCSLNFIHVYTSQRSGQLKKPPPHCPYPHHSKGELLIWSESGMRCLLYSQHQCSPIKGSAFICLIHLLRISLWASKYDCKSRVMYPLLPSSQTMYRSYLEVCVPPGQLTSHLLILLTNTDHHTRGSSCILWLGH